VPKVRAFLLALFVTSVAQAGGPTATLSSIDEDSADIPGELLVDFADDLDTTTISDLLSRLAVSFTPTGLEAETRAQVVRVAGQRLEEVRTKLGADPRVEIVEPHARVRALFVPNDPLFGEQWHLAKVGAERAWSFSTGRGATVAVVDTGIACENFGPFSKATDLAETRCVAGYDFVNKGPHASDDQGHGTHVAGTIAQSTNNGLGAAGIAFDARLMPVKVLSADGWGTTSDVADGIRWAADHGAQVINLSLGGPRNSRVLQKAIDHAKKKGVTVIAAAGNSGGRVEYPGGSDGVIGVSALDQTDSLAWFSSRGPGVDLAAPGVDVVQQTICNGGRDHCERFPSYSGTSMAAPHVAGAAALLVSLGVTEPVAVEKALLGSTRKIGSPKLFGRGALDANRALRKAALQLTITRILALALSIFVLFRWVRRAGAGHSPWRAPFLASAFFTGPGLFFFAPFLLPRHNDWIDLLARPVGDWDLLISAPLHGFLPFANVLLPFGLTLLLLGARPLRPVIAGLATGTCAYLAATVVNGGVHSPLGAIGFPVFAAANALACLVLARLVLVEKR
jgi:serine protease